MTMIREVRSKTNKHFHFPQGKVFKAWRPNINNVLVFDGKHALLLGICRFYMDFEVVQHKEQALDIDGGGQACKQVVIENQKQLLEAIALYKKLYPQSYTRFDELYCWLRDDADRNSGGGLFGHSVAGELDDDCYGFECRHNDEQAVVYEYVGICKC